MSEDVLTFTPLGAGQEVGRSCHVLEFRDMTILLDCGIHPGYDGLNGLPFLDRLEPGDIDVCLITHFHLDHAASLPYLTERTNFKGRIFMTHPTKAVLRLLLGDYLRLLSMKNAKPEDVLYTEAELHSCLAKIELVDFHQTVTVGGLSFTALNAGHVLGACMYWMDLNGQRSVLYTGDYSLEDDRHLMAAEIPEKSPDVLITESTYGVQVHASRAEREAVFTGTVERIVTQGGRCLIPVFALGRAQELLLILDEYWQSQAHLRDVPIWYASKLASRALRVYQTYANMMNARIRQQLDVGNPFQFRYIRNLKSIDVDSFDDTQPAVVFASPGMLQSGVSRQLFDRWAANPKNGVVIAGYAVEHTLAKEIMSQPKEVVTLDGRKQPLSASVTTCSFSAHVDFVMNRSFIQQVKPRHILLVHGQKDEMGRLKSALMLQYRSLPESKRPTITMPPNLQEVKMRFARRRSAKVLGRLAMPVEKEEDQEKPKIKSEDDTDKAAEHVPPPNKKTKTAEPLEGQEVSGILVTHQFQSKLVAPEDLATYTPLRLGNIRSVLHVPFGGSIKTLTLFLKEMFAGIEVQEGQEQSESHVGDGNQKTVTTFDLQGKVTVTVGRTEGVASVTWDAHPQNDVLADAVVALISQAQCSPAAIRLTSQPCRHRGTASSDAQKSPASPEELTESRLRLIKETLSSQFQQVEMVSEGKRASFEITTAGGGTEDITCMLTVTFPDDKGRQATVHAESSDTALAKNVQECIQSLAAATYPIPIEN